MIINFYSKVKTDLPFTLKIAREIINEIVKELKSKKDFEVTISIVSDKEIKLLNKQYRGKDKVTDVLTFSQQEGENLILPKGRDNYLGDILICYPQIKRQAKIYKKSIKAEFTLLLIHGFLHLLDYEDETAKGFLKMNQLQKKILAKIYD